MEASWLDSASTTNGCIPGFLIFFHSIFVHLAFCFYWIISSGETHISGAPASFVLLWLFVRTDRSSCKMPMPGKAATPMAGGSTLTRNFPWIRFLFLIIFLFCGNITFLRLLYYFWRKKTKRRRIHFLGFACHWPLSGGNGLSVPSAPLHYWGSDVFPTNSNELLECRH